MHPTNAFFITVAISLAGACTDSSDTTGRGDPAVTGDPGTGDPGTGDPGTGDPGTGDPGTGDPDTGDPGTGDPGAGDPGAQTRTTIYPGFCPSTDTLPGAYQGTLASNLNDLSSPECGGSAAGRDGAVRMTISPGETLTISYTSTHDGVLYILDSCPVMSSCLGWADNGGEGVAETLSWTNSDTVANPIYVILDSFQLQPGGTFTLDLVVQ